MKTIKMIHVVAEYHPSIASKLTLDEYDAEIEE